MKHTLALLLAVTACLEPAELDETEQAVDSAARLRMFEITSGHVWSSVQTTPNSSLYTGFDDLAGTDIRKLATERNADGRLSLFAIGGDGVLYGRYQTTLAGSWSPWESFGGAWIEQVITARNFDGRIELFVRNTAGNIFHRFQVVPNGGWNPEGWLPFGGNDVREISAAKRADGRLEVIGVGGDGHVYRRVQFAPGSGWDADWSNIGGTNIRTAILAKGHRGMEIVAIDTSNAVQTALEPASTWSAFTQFSTKPMASLSLGTMSDGRLEVLALSYVGAVYEITQQKITFAWPPDYNARYWDGVAQVAMNREADGALVAFVRKTDNTVWTSKQTTVWPALAYFTSNATDVAVLDQE